MTSNKPSPRTGTQMALGLREASLLDPVQKTLFILKNNVATDIVGEAIETGLRGERQQENTEAVLKVQEKRPVLKELTHADSTRATTPSCTSGDQISPAEYRIWRWV